MRPHGDRWHRRGHRRRPWSSPGRRHQRCHTARRPFEAPRVLEELSETLTGFRTLRDSSLLRLGRRRGTTSRLRTILGQPAGQSPHPRSQIAKSGQPTICPVRSRSLPLQPQHDRNRRRQTKIRTISGPAPDRRLLQLSFCLVSLGTAAGPPADEEPAATLRQGTPPPPGGSTTSLTATAGTPLVEPPQDDSPSSKSVRNSLRRSPAGPESIRRSPSLR
jgi:hypothetical protein